MRIENEQQAESRLLKILLVLLTELKKENIDIHPFPQEGGDFNFTVTFKLNGKKIKMEFSMTPSGQLSLETEPGIFAMVDENGDMTEFWKQLFNRYYLSTIKTK